MITIPAEIRRNVPLFFGERGHEWLAALPQTTAALLDRWRLRLVPREPYDGGSHALVLAVVRPDGTPAVLKIPCLDDENSTEWLALRAYDGDGAVKLYAHDPATGALLLEEAVPGTPLSRHRDRPEAMAVLFALLRRLRRPVPPEVAASLPSARALAAGWVRRFPEVQEALRVPGADRVVATAVEIALEYAAAADGPEMLINRDGHLQNVLAAEREPWLLIDPKPVLGEAAFEGGHPVLTLLSGALHTTTLPMASPDTSPDDAERLLAVFADGLGVSRERLRGWALLRSVENLLWEAREGGDPRPHLAQATALLTS